MLKQEFEKNIFFNKNNKQGSITLPSRIFKGRKKAKKIIIKDWEIVE